jgi:hypothetical protein
MNLTDLQKLISQLQVDLKKARYKSSHPLRVEDNYANDSAAATAGIKIGELYHTSGTVKIRIS